MREELLRCLSAISDETRMSIVELLLRYNFCAGALARRLDISEAAVSQHLKVLKECGLVTSRKCGYFRCFEVNKDKIEELSNSIHMLTAIKRLPCDPSMEMCSPKTRILCHGDKKCMGCDCCKDCRTCQEMKANKS